MQVCAQAGEPDYRENDKWRKGEVALGGVGELGTLKTALRAQYKTSCNLHD